MPASVLACRASTGATQGRGRHSHPAELGVSGQPAERRFYTSIPSRLIGRNVSGTDAAELDFYATPSVTAN